MRGLAIALLVLAGLIGGARMFTGVIYPRDEPAALLVLKRSPTPWIERPEALDRPLSEQVVLDREEPRLFYGELYRRLMGMAPFLVPALAGLAALLVVITAARSRP